METSINQKSSFVDKAMAVFLVSAAVILVAAVSGCFKEKRGPSVTCYRCKHVIDSASAKTVDSVNWRGEHEPLTFCKSEAPSCDYIDINILGHETYFKNPSPVEVNSAGQRLSGDRELLTASNYLNLRIEVNRELLEKIAFAQANRIDAWSARLDAVQEELGALRATQPKPRTILPFEWRELGTASNIIFTNFIWQTYTTNATLR